MLIASTVLGLAAAAAGQGVSEGWYGLESFSGSGSDQGVEIAEWKDDEDQVWVYVAGYVTQGSYTRLAVWRYKADEPAGLQAYDKRAIFPDPTFYPTISGHTRATGIIVDPDPETGGVYVCGSTQISTQTSDWPVFGSDSNYVILRYNFDLTTAGSPWLSPGGSAPPGFRLYDHAGLDDKAVDIVVVEEGVPYTAPLPRVCVTGDSADPTGGSDIATLKIEGSTGDFSGSWPAAGAGLPALFPLDARAQFSPVWSGLGTSYDTVVAATCRVWGPDGSPWNSVLGVGGASPGGPLLTRAELWSVQGWARLGTGVSAPGVRAVRSPAEGRWSAPAPVLFAGGMFSAAGGVPARNIARYAPPSWSNLGGGTSATVLVLFWHPGPGPLGPALYAGGGFASAGGVEVNSVARWDGQAWSPLGLGLKNPQSGQNGIAYAMALYDDDGPGPRPEALYVAGSFKYAGGMIVNSIARWDGFAWEALGSGIASQASAQALCVFDPDGPGPLRERLYVGGSFAPNNGLMCWDGQSWSAVPGWIGNSPRAMAVFDDDGPGPNRPALFIGGLFVAATGIPVNHIAKWDGQQWFSVGGGVSEFFAGPEVLTLTVFDEDGPGPNPGGLYVGGFFNRAGGLLAPGIARWGCPMPPACSANCSRDFDPVTGAHVLTIADFACFQTRFVLQDPYADCDADGSFTIADFGCFQAKFAAGCP